MLKAGDISAIPPAIELLQGENVRKGFIAPGDFAALLEEIPDADARDLVDSCTTQAGVAARVRNSNGRKWI